MDGIAKPKGQKVLKFRAGVTRDIVSEVLAAVPDSRSQTAGFAKRFTPDRNGMYDLFAWVRDNIKYQEDPLGVQFIREPARLWHDRKGDCKSFTLFIVSVLENMGLDYIIRFSNTQKKGSRTVNHVYPIAILPDGTAYILDAVYRKFNAQANFFYKKDYTMAEIYRLSGIGAVANEVEQYWADIRKIDAEIPDEVLDGGDITNMTRGEFARFQNAQLFQAHADTATSQRDTQRFEAAAEAVRSGSVAGIRGIGAFTNKDVQKIEAFLNQTATQTAPAFQTPVLALPENMAGLGSLGDKIKDLAKDVLNVWKKVLNWMFKAAMPLAAPFFLYSFLKKKVGPKTDRKKEKQGKIIAWINKVGKFDDPSDVLNAIKTGIVKKFGKTPETLLADPSKIAGYDDEQVGVVVTAVITAVTTVVEIISKIASIFKKKKEDTENLSVSDAPDFDEMKYELAMSATPSAPSKPSTTSAPSKPSTTSAPSKPSTTSSDSGGSSGDMAKYGLIAAAAVGVYFLTQK